MPTTDLQLQPLAVDMAGAARMLGMSRSYLYEMDASGELGPMSHRVGGKRLFCVEELAAWCRHGMPSRGQWLPMWERICQEGAR